MYKRIPRKLKKRIPKGMYCYTLLSFNKKTYTAHIKPCPFYQHIKTKDKPEHLQDEIDKEYPEEYVGWCKLLQYELLDQCKSCGINKYRK